MLGLLLATLTLVGALSSAAARHQEASAEIVLEELGNGYELHLAYPRLGIAAADTELDQWARALAAEFDAARAARDAREPPYSGSLTYEITRDDAAAVSILFDYSLYTGGAHPNLLLTTYTFLLPEGTRVFLPELIGEAGIQRVSALARAALADSDPQLDPALVRLGTGPYAENFEDFELLEDQLVLHFEPYAVAAYAAGPQEVRIPLAELHDVWRADPRAPLPSFDCALATTPIERAICADFALAQLDRRTAEAFAMRLRLEAAGLAPPRVLAQQQAWLAHRDAACAAARDAALVDCLAAEYRPRLAALQSFQ